MHHHDRKQQDGGIDFDIWDFLPPTKLTSLMQFLSIAKVRVIHLGGNLGDLFELVLICINIHSQVSIDLLNRVEFIHLFNPIYRALKK